MSDDLKETLQRFTRLPGIGPKLRLQGVEFFYKMALTGWLKLAADLQIVDPAAVSARTDTTFGIRAKIDF